MSRKLNEFIKIVAALLAVVAVVGLLGSFISDRKSDEDPSESESVRFEESTEKESTPLEDEVVDHTDCKNEHNWSIYTTNTGSNNHIDNYNYRCGYCNTLFFSYGSIGDPISPGFFYGIADLSTAHKFDHSTGISSHFNHNMGGSYLYISSKASGGKITTSFKTLDVPVGGKYMARRPPKRIARFAPSPPA